MPCTSQSAEVDGTSNFDGVVVFFDSPVRIRDDVQFTFGGADDVKMVWETADADANAIVVTLPEGGAMNVPVYIIGDATIFGIDLGLFQGMGTPTCQVMSDDGTEHFGFGVNDTNVPFWHISDTILVDVDETKMSHKMEIVIDDGSGTETYFIMLTQS